MVEMINPTYLQVATIQQINTHFHQNPGFKSTTLAQFFTDEGLEYILDQIDEEGFIPDRNEIVYRRSKANLPSAVLEVLQSNIFQELTERILGTPITFDKTAQFHKYGHRDYRIIHDDAVLEPGYDLILDLTPEWDDQFGGYVTYTDGSGQFYTIDSQLGNLTLVERTGELHYFVKYINHYAENLNRYLVIANSPVG